VQVVQGSYINAVGSLFDVPCFLIFSVCLQIYLISFTNLESTILPVYLGDSLLANTEYTAGFYTFQREVKEIDGMNRNNKGWEPE
jgi:hypothetical protein